MDNSVGLAAEFVRIELDGGRRDDPARAAEDERAERAAAGRARRGRRRRVEPRHDIRAVVIYGGQKIFAAGADIKEMADMSAGQMAAHAVRLQDAFSALARIPKPTIAAVTGYALGGGLELALTADFRVLGDTARVGQPEILLGVIPGAGGTQRLARLIGPAKAKDLVFSGRHVRADEALAMGIADRVVPDRQRVRDGHELGARVRRGSGRGAGCCQDGRSTTGLAMGLAEGLRLESALFAGLFGTDDRTAGMRSFLEHGPGHATFTGS